MPTSMPAGSKTCRDVQDHWIGGHAEYDRLLR